LKYLWNFELTNESCGWIHYYYEAQLNYPAGKVIGLKQCNNNSLSYAINPVKTYTSMKNIFHQLSAKAAKLYQQRTTLELNVFLPKIVDLDVCLYNLLQDWYLENDPCTDSDMFSSFQYFSEYHYRNYNMYFNNGTILYPQLHEARILPMFIGISRDPNKINTFYCNF
jgi:hypothetical protein